MMKDIVIAVLLIICSFQAESRPDGATILACGTLAPVHGINQIGDDPFPYNVDLSAFALSPSGYGYTAGKKYYIRLKGTQKDPDYRGFLVQARTVGDNSPVGTFARRVSNKPVCTSDTAATHVDNKQKSYVILYWTAPPADTGPIKFWYSFVDINRNGKTRHWGPVRSKVVHEVPECTIEGQEFTFYGTACPPTCDYDKLGGCMQKAVGCQCPYGTVLDKAANKCVKKENCGCQVEGQVVNECAADPRCATTCSNRFMPRPCPAVCVVNGCECPNGTVIDEVSKRCVPPSECPEILPCPVKGQFYTADCFLANATCDDHNPITNCDYLRCVCPRGQVVDEKTNSCIKGTQCPNMCKIEEISGRIRYRKKNRKLVLKFSLNDQASKATFECKLNDNEYVPCTSPMVWRKLNLSEKKHVATVKATCIYNDDAMSTMTKEFVFQVK